MALATAVSGEMELNSAGIYIDNITTTPDYPSKGQVTVTCNISSAIARTGSLRIYLYGYVDDVFKLTTDNATVVDNTTDSISMSEGTAQYSFVLDAVTDLGCQYAYDKIVMYIRAYAGPNQTGNHTVWNANETNIENLNWNYFTGDFDVDEPDRAEDYDDGWHFKFTTGTLLKSSKVHFRIHLYHEGNSWGYLDSESPDVESQHETWKVDGTDVTSTGVTIGSTAVEIECYSDNTNNPFQWGSFTYDIQWEVITD